MRGIVSLERMSKGLRLKYEALIQDALKAREQAYAPFSKFPVGAAVLTTSGEVFTGANIENSSYGLTCCAERSAIQKAINAGHKKFVAIAVIAKTKGPCAPCGACRQVMFEFGNSIEVVMKGLGGPTHVAKIETLLPYGFRLKEQVRAGRGQKRRK